MSAVADVKANLDALKPLKGETAENLARRMFYLQMEIYSAHAGRDLVSYGDDDFSLLPADVKSNWIKSARQKIKEDKK